MRMQTLSRIRDKAFVIGGVPRGGRPLLAPAKASSATFTDGAGEVGEATFSDIRPTSVDQLDAAAEFLRLELPRIFRTGVSTGALASGSSTGSGRLSVEQCKTPHTLRQSYKAACVMSAWGKWFNMGSCHGLLASQLCEGLEEACICWPHLLQIQGRGALPG